MQIKKILTVFWGDPMDLAKSVLTKGTNTFVSTVQSKEGAIEAAIQKTLAALEK